MNGAGSGPCLFQRGPISVFSAPAEKHDSLRYLGDLEYTYATRMADLPGAARCEGNESDVQPPVNDEQPSSNTANDDQCPRNLDESFACSLYVSRADGPQDCGFQGGELLKSNLEAAIRLCNPSGNWRVSKTSRGLIAAFVREIDADKLLQRGDLARSFGGPVQVARFSARDSRYRQAVLLRDVPWAVHLEDVNSALRKQGISAGSVERYRQHVRVEVLEAGHYEVLLRQGLDFFGAARFCAVPERCWRNIGGGGPAQVLPAGRNPSAEASNLQSYDGVLQCYRCQGFWHVAANCRHLPRCVRCGEPHSVEFCPRPRNSPICCHCSGPHHAGYRQCPVRLQLSNSTPISITLSTARIGDQRPVSTNDKSSATSQEQNSLKQTR
ncbi:hypothetical protein KM043_001687 [Ampulex compressa]|nr:hypothetical protein KM043_001687 [Ampulex compressa]